MKKAVILLFQLVFILPVMAQDDDPNPIISTRQGFGDQKGMMMNMGFVNPKARTEGSAYYYDNWDSVAMVYLKEQGRYKIENANVNLFDNTLETLYDQGNVFTFDTANLLQIIIDKKIFRPLPIENELKLLELFYNEGVAIYKYYYISYSKSSPNPMVNRRTNKYIRNERFYLYKEGELIKLKLTKNAFSKLFKTSNLSEDAIKDYISDNNLSLKKEDELIQVLNFLNN